jgi:hypothetical protein
MITAKPFRCLNRLGTGYMSNLGTASCYYYPESLLNHFIPHITSWSMEENLLGLHSRSAFRLLQKVPCGKSVNLCHM